jgi:hypothetical protein
MSCSMFHLGLSWKNKWDKCPTYGSLGLLFKETFLPICSQQQVSVRKREERKKKKGREIKERKRGEKKRDKKREKKREKKGERKGKKRKEKKGEL